MSSYQQQFFQQPFSQQPFGQQPFGQQPFGQQPFNQHPFNQQPFGQQPFGQQPFGQQPFGQQPFNQHPFNQQPFGQPFGQQPFSQQPFSQQPFSQQPFSQQPFGQQPFGQQPFSQQPFSQQPFSQQPFSQQSFFQQPFGHQPFGQQLFGQQPFFQQIFAPTSAQWARPAKWEPFFTQTNFLDDCPHCSVQKEYCDLCKWIYCPMHEKFHDNGIAYFGDSSADAINKSCHTRNGEYAPNRFYLCPFPGCKKLAFSNCGDNECCGLFCQEHIYHKHFICQGNKCNKLAKVRKYFPNNKTEELFCCDEHYHSKYIQTYGM